MLILAAIFTPIIAGLILQQWRNLMIGLGCIAWGLQFRFGAIGHYPQLCLDGAGRFAVNGWTPLMCSWLGYGHHTLEPQVYWTDDGSKCDVFSLR